MPWTAPKTFNTGDVLPAVDLNTHLRDNLKWIHDQGADLASGATLTLTTEFHKVTGTTQVDNIATPVAGHRAMLWFTGACPLRNNGGGTGNLRLVGGTDRTVSADTILHFRSDGSVWREVGAPGLGSGTLLGARVYPSGSQNVSADGTAIAFDSETYDSNTYHDTVTNNSRITIPAGMGGKYLSLFLLPVSYAAGNFFTARPKKNGTTNCGQKSRTTHRSDITDSFVAGLDIMDLVAGDYVQIVCDRSGGTWSVEGGNPDAAWSMTKVAA